MITCEKAKQKKTPSDVLDEKKKKPFKDIKEYRKFPSVFTVVAH